jgi:hypothetical protein
MNAVTLHASPSQRRCGIVVRAKGDLQLTAVVLPKPWRSRASLGSNSAQAVEWTGARLCLTLYEGDRIRIEFPSDDARAADRREIAEGLVSQHQAQAVASSEQEQPLFAFSTPTNTVAASGPRESVDVDAIVDLFRLCELSGIDPISRSAGDLGALPVEAAWLLAYLQTRFNQSTADSLRHARRGYVERRERLSTMRGRPRGSSLAVALATGEAVVECDFEDFEYSTPLLRTIAACLDAVIRTQPSGSNALRARMEKNRRDATSLRIQLAEVRSFEAAEALLFARRHRLSRLERPWVQAFGLAPAILRRSALLGQSDHPTALSAGLVGAESAQDSLRIELDTAVIWQELLKDSAQRIGSLRKASCDSPWDNCLEPPRPDITFEWPRTDTAEPIILDAKYKFFDAKPTAEDAYQMFVYSHLAKLGGREARRLFLGYVDAGAHATVGRHLHSRLPRYSRDNKFLGLLPLPWPARAELSEPEVYRTRLCGELERLLRILI